MKNMRVLLQLGFLYALDRDGILHPIMYDTTVLLRTIPKPLHFACIVKDTVALVVSDCPNNTIYF